MKPLSPELATLEGRYVTCLGGLQPLFVPPPRLREERWTQISVLDLLETAPQVGDKLTMAQTGQVWYVHAVHLALPDQRPGWLIRVGKEKSDPCFPSS